MCRIAPLKCYFIPIMFYERTLVLFLLKEEQKENLVNVENIMITRHKLTRGKLYNIFFSSVII